VNRAAINAVARVARLRDWPSLRIPTIAALQYTAFVFFVAVHVVFFVVKRFG
jgi:uncharacterized membrane protein